MEKEQRNAIQRAVKDARNLLERDFGSQLLEVFDIDVARVRVADGPGSHLDGEQRFLRNKLTAAIAHKQAAGNDLKEALLLFRREMAFTALNRFVALKLMEARSLVHECVSQGLLSSGFEEFTGLAPALLADQEGSYQLFLQCLFEDVSREVKVLFDPRDPASLLWPRRAALLELLEILNRAELAEIWSEDETIGWVYQYFNDEAERKEMRKSSAPRNSREMAVRNQFFTPRYVVEFLTDNTLGRIWYEMRRGETCLWDRCRYLVRRPTEIFLQPGEAVPESATGHGESDGETLSQEELLRQPVHIPHRPLKDPREILLLDPACGSMHFGLYAFDLFTLIYEEAWDIAHGSDDAAKTTATFAPFIAFATSFADKATFLSEVPRLIVEHNIHGIDIDPRATQIARLSLWLRAHRALQHLGVAIANRPSISRANVVCAEPMPGEKELLLEFVTQEFSPGEQPAFTHLLEIIFDQMTLAGEAGSLLRIEEDIRTAIADAKRIWKQGPSFEQASLFSLPGGATSQAELGLDLSGITDKQFWEQAEQRIYNALQRYAEQAENGSGFKRRLFADDAAHGFAFIDLCRNKYDAIVMNPPFGLGLKATEKYFQASYPGSGAEEVAASFYTRSLELLSTGGRIGEISSRTCFFLPTLAEWRKEIVLGKSTLDVYADLGERVLDGAFNETSAYVSQKDRYEDAWALFGMFHRNPSPEKALVALTSCAIREDITGRRLSDFEILPDRPLCYWVSSTFLCELPGLRPMGRSAADIQMGLAPRGEFRFSRLWWEVKPAGVGRGRNWVCYAKGGELSPYYSDVELLLKAGDSLAEIKASLNHKYPYLKGNLGWVLHPENDYFQPGLTFGQRTTFLRMCVLPEDCYFSVAGKGVFGREQSSTSLLQAINTPVAQFLTYLRRESLSMNPQFQEGDVARTPWPQIEVKTIERFQDWAMESVNAVRAIASFDEVDHSFKIFSSGGDSQLAQASAAKIISRNEEKASEILGQLVNLSEADYSFIHREIMPRWHARSIANWHVPIEASAAFSYALGNVFGRWDIRHATGSLQALLHLDPFAPLPVCSPGMLQGDDGLPLSPEAGRQLRGEGIYPLDIAWDGILVNDPDHPLDIERRVQAALAVLWGVQAEELTQEACSILDVHSLREWFRRPAGFFAEHLTRYSKSNRQAPIYWPLSTGSGSYSVWLYYHRFTADTLYRVLQDYVDPRISQAERDCFQWQQQVAVGGTTDAAQQLQSSQELLDDLKQLKAEQIGRAHV